MVSPDKINPVALRERNLSLIARLKSNQEECFRILNKAKENLPSSDSKRPKRASVAGDHVTRQQTTPPHEMKRKVLPSSAKARKALHQRSFCRSKPKKSPSNKTGRKRAYTSTPVTTPTKDKDGNNRRLGPKTPHSILKKRKIIDRNVTVDSRLSDGSLCITPDADSSQWLNFSYTTSPGTPRRYRSVHHTGTGQCW